MDGCKVPATVCSPSPFLLITPAQSVCHFGERLIPGIDEEALELEEIRKACLPEVLLAYLVVLNSSAQYVSREYLLRSLEVGAAVASKDSDLGPCFVLAGRMPELVDALAFTSTTIILANEHGGGKKRTPARLGIWSTKGSLNTAE